LHLHRSAAPRARHHRRHPDRDHLSPLGFRRNPGHHQRRPGRSDDDDHLSRLHAGAPAVRCGRRLGGRHHRRHPRQHRRHLSHSADRPELGPLGEEAMARAISTRRKVTFTILGWTIGFLIFFPVLWTVLTSFKTEGTAIATPPQFLFFDWTMENYVAVQNRSNYMRHMSNSIVISVGSTLIGLLVAIPA